MLEAKESVKGKCARRDSVEQMSIDTPTLIHPRPKLQNVQKIYGYTQILIHPRQKIAFTQMLTYPLMHNVKNLHEYIQIDSSTSQSLIVKKITQILSGIETSTRYNIWQNKLHCHVF